MKKLDLGCGFKKRKDAVGVDKNPSVPADIHHDLDVFPYPFEDNAFDDIHIINVLEHLQDIVAVMKEIYRISHNGARIYITVPHFSSADFYTDVTHKRAFSCRSFDYFIPGTDLFGYSYNQLIRFKKHYALLGWKEPESWWHNPLLWMCNKRQDWYERRFAFIYPQQTIHFLLEALK